jgi:hypothetical protein
MFAGQSHLDRDEPFWFELSREINHSHAPTTQLALHGEARDIDEATIEGKAVRLIRASRRRLVQCIDSTGR